MNSGHTAVHVRARSLAALSAVGIFLCFGAMMAGLAGTTLLWQGTFLDAIWGLNEPAHEHLAPLGKMIGLLFLLLSLVLALAGIGWFQRRVWGWWLAVLVIATQVLGDIFNLVRGDIVRGSVGIVVATPLLFYIANARTKACFR